MSRRLLPVALALVLAAGVTSAVGQTVVVAAHGHHAHHGAKWRRWCRHHPPCLRRHPWAVAENRRLRHQIWKHWCEARPRCRAHHPALGRRGRRGHGYVLDGPVGTSLRTLPEGNWVSTFVATGRTYHVSPRLMMAIGLIESSGGTDGTAYMGCMDASTFGSWPAQIRCAAGVLSSVGLAGYNAGNPSYPSEVRARAAGIHIRAR